MITYEKPIYKTEYSMVKVVGFFPPKLETR